MPYHVLRRLSGQCSWQVHCIGIGLLLVLLYFSLWSLSALQEKYKFPVREVYALWLELTPEYSRKIQQEADLLASLYQGPVHPAHVTFCFARARGSGIVLNVAERLAQQLRPFELEYETIITKPWNPDTRWPGGVVLIYKSSLEAVAAAHTCMTMYNTLSEFAPHINLLYDYTPASANDKAGEGSLGRLIQGNETTRLPSTVKVVGFSVWYTPLRDKWFSAKDMRNIVGQWEKVATYYFPAMGYVT